MNLKSLGEDRLIAALTRGLPSRSDVRVAAGDDCAVIGGPRDLRWRLLKTDAVAEGVHFLPTEDLRRVGWKALCRAISDIAAMGGVPEHALIALAAPPTMEVAQVQALYAGLRRAARKFGVAIVGGETTRSQGRLSVTVTLTGSVERAHCVLRSTGRAGDVLFVTGRLGGSIAGHHLDFKPRLTEARWLVEHYRPRAMMDLSDGLGADLPRLAKASGCGYLLDESAVPKNRNCTIAQALGDGEDYELLFAIAPREATRLESSWPKAFPKLPLTRIGTLTGKITALRRKSAGYDHFA
ncbi:MAG TPA: thiamine-phosphate kinase [Chthoniobacteraceae bacterium]